MLMLVLAGAAMVTMARHVVLFCYANNEVEFLSRIYSRPAYDIRNLAEHSPALNGRKLCLLRGTRYSTVEYSRVDPIDYPIPTPFACIT